MITNVLSPVGEMANLLVPVLSSLFHTKVIRSRWLSWWRLWEVGYSEHFDDQHQCHPCKHRHPSGKTERDRLGATGASLSSLYPVLQSSFTLSSSSLYHRMKTYIIQIFFCLSWVSLINLTLTIDFFEGSPNQTKCKPQEANKEWRKSAPFFPLLLYFGQ